jgi:hypothetical protein
MGALLILWIAAIYLLLAAWITYKVRSWWVKSVVAIALLLIPTADAVYGRIKLKQMCEAEGGLKIYKTVEGVEGLYVDRLGATPEWVTKYGYRFVEGEDVSGKPVRLSGGPAGKIVEEKNVALKSQYRYEYSGGDFGIGYAYDEQRVRDLQTNEILARARNISYEGGWVERFVASLYAAKGYAGACQEGRDTISLYKIVNETLKPAN